jgi:hypothetical protein
MVSERKTPDRRIGRAVRRLLAAVDRALAAAREVAAARAELDRVVNQPALKVISAEEGPADG